MEKLDITPFQAAISGGIASLASKTATAPLDRVKILMQAQNKHFKDLGILETTTKIVKKENVKALFKGNGTQMVRIIPYGAISFASYEFFKSLLPPQSSPDSHWNKFVAGAGAGVVTVTTTYSLDTIRTRLAFQVRNNKYSGIIMAGRSIYNTEGGIRGLYRGIVPSLVGSLPQFGLTFYGFEASKSYLLKHENYNWAKKIDEDGTKTLSGPAKLLCGAVAGPIGQMISYPLDVARKKMQLGHYSGRATVEVLRNIYREYGVVGGLYRGASINFIKAIPAASVTFYVYETLKQIFSNQRRENGFSENREVDQS